MSFLAKLKGNLTPVLAKPRRGLGGAEVYYRSEECVCETLRRYLVACIFSLVLAIISFFR
jgi:hypothetical protein